MLELRAQGTTVLLSSHQLSEVEAVCDGVTILNRGRVAAGGHIDDLLNVAGQLSVVARGRGRAAGGCRRARDGHGILPAARGLFSVPRAPSVRRS